jgi:hypothetical protein
MRETRRATRDRGTPGVLLLVALCLTLPCCTSRSSGRATPITYSGKPGAGVQFGCGTPVVKGSAIGIDVRLTITDKAQVSLKHWHATATITNHSNVEYWVAPIGALGVSHSKVSTGPIPDVSASGGGEPGPRLRRHTSLTVPIGLGAAACVPTTHGNLLPTPATVDLAAVVTLWDINQNVGRNVRSSPVRVVIH